MSSIPCMHHDKSNKEMVLVRRYPPVKPGSAGYVHPNSSRQPTLEVLNRRDRQWALLRAYSKGDSNRVIRLAEKLGLISKWWSSDHPYDIYRTVLHQMVMDSTVEYGEITFPPEYVPES